MRNTLVKSWLALQCRMIPSVQRGLVVVGATPLLDAGQRVHVRFAHGSESLVWQWGRRLEQMFLRGFGV